MCDRCEERAAAGVRALEALANGEEVPEVPEGHQVAEMQLTNNGDGTSSLTLPNPAFAALLLTLVANGQMGLGQ